MNNLPIMQELPTSKTSSEIARTMRGASIVMQQNFLAYATTREPASLMAVHDMELITFVLMWCANIRPKDFAAGNRMAVEMFGNLIPGMDEEIAQLNERAGQVFELLDKCAGE